MKLFTQASLSADALCLGPHWVYNQGKLARLYPEGVYALSDPATEYHASRKAGQFTHYGDQLQLLAASIEARDGFDAEAWRADWVVGMTDYDGYIDGATFEVLAAQGASPSNSNDLAGASRMGPVLDAGLDEKSAIAAARQQTALTHGDAGVQDAAEFFVRAVFAVQRGESFPDAFQSAAGAGHYDALDVSTHLSAARTADLQDYKQVASTMGLTCHVPEAFPLTLYMALRPGASMRETLSENALAGGDSSARAMLLALLFAARDPVQVTAYANTLGLGQERPA